MLMGGGGVMGKFSRTGLKITPGEIGLFGKVFLFGKWVKTRIGNGLNLLTENLIRLNALDPIGNRPEATENLSNFVGRMPALVDEIVKRPECFTRGQRTNVMEN